MASNPEDAADKVDIVLDQMVDLTRLVNEVIRASKQGPTATVIHKTSGSTFASVVASCVAVCCLVLVVLVSIIMRQSMTDEFQRENAELHDLRAWKDVHSNDIAALKGDVRQIKENPAKGVYK